MSALMQSYSTPSSSRLATARPTRPFVPTLSLASRSRPVNSKPASLLATVQRALQHHADHLDQLPPIPELLPWSVVEPFVKRITRPHVLENLQRRAPQIVEHTEPLWRAFIIRDFAFGKEKLENGEVRDPAMWPEIYKKFKRKKERDQLKGVAALKKAVQETRPSNGGLEIKRTVKAEAPSYAAKRRFGAGGGYVPTPSKKDFFGRLKHEAASKSVHRPAPVLGKRTAAQAQLHATGTRKVLKAPADMVADLKESKSISIAKAPSSGGQSEHDFVFGSKERVREVSKPLWAPGERPEKVAVKTVSSSRPLWDPGRSPDKSPAKQFNRVTTKPYDLVKDREQRLRDLKAGKTTAALPRDGTVTARPSLTQQQHPQQYQQQGKLSATFLEDDNGDDDDDDLFGN